MKYLFAFLFFGVSIFCNAQKNDSIQDRHNIIKLNLVSSALFTNSVVFSYERMIKTRPNHSWGVMGGAMRFPTVADFGSSIHVKDETKKTGFVVGGEYRLYLKKENKFPAPHGVYIGPYVNYYFFRNDRNLTYTPKDSQTTTSALLKTDINVLNIGAQLGYQFVFKNRWTVDMVIFGPSIAYYGMKLNLDGDFDLTEEEILQDEILAALTEKFPLIKDLLTEKDVKLQGKNTTWSAGFRYQLNVGYRFARIGKKK
jgi:hypothetical protein